MTEDFKFVWRSDNSKRMLSTVNFKGVYWKDIDWDLPVHEITHCNYCGSDAAEGHQAACLYLKYMWDGAPAWDWHRLQIRHALKREGCLDDEDNIVGRPSGKTSKKSRNTKTNSK